jgi:hypothetical protein
MLKRKPAWLAVQEVAAMRANNVGHLQTGSLHFIRLCARFVKASPDNHQDH